jgi:hypothetical protein
LIKLEATESDQIGELILEANDHPTPYLKIELDNVPLKILDSRRTDAELQTAERMDLIEENFKDLLNSWISHGPPFDTMNPYEYVDDEDEDEDPDLKEMSD